jgi:hypothetical protein
MLACTRATHGESLNIVGHTRIRATMLQVATAILLAFCYAGIVAGVSLHILALATALTVPGPIILAMHLGLFAVAIPTIIISNKVLSSVRPKDLWAAMRAATPVWLYRFVRVLGIYWVMVFLVFILIVSKHETPDGPMSARTLAFFAAGWTTGYAALAQYLYLVRNRLVARRLCPQGHEVGASARYCEVCGTPLPAL